MAGPLRPVRGGHETERLVPIAQAHPCPSSPSPSAAQGPSSPRIINLGGGLNFYDFINRLRVEDACRRLVAGEGSSILDAALDSGFNSKSTFHEAFKKWTGTTPSAYRRLHAKAESRSPTSLG